VLYLACDREQPEGKQILEGLTELSKKIIARDEIKRRPGCSATANENGRKLPGSLSLPKLPGPCRTVFRRQLVAYEQTHPNRRRKAWLTHLWLLWTLLPTTGNSNTSERSIRINDQWRICFEWPKVSPGPVNVEIVDFH